MSGVVKNIKTLIGDVEMVPYTIIAERGDYEERLYPAKLWVCSSIESCDRETTCSVLYRILFKYISGNNEPNTRIDMTSPFTTFVQPNFNYSNDTKYTIGIYIPEDFQKNPPSTPDKNIFIEKRQEIRVMARRFGGFVNDNAIEREVKKLTSALQTAGENDVNYNQYYIAVYDPPYKPFNRRNEIWFVKQTNHVNKEIIFEHDSDELI